MSKLKSHSRLTPALNAQAYQRAFAQRAEMLSAEAIAQRTSALQHFLATGLPVRALEAWKYTDFGALSEEDVQLATGRPDVDLAGWQLPDAQILMLTHSVSGSSASRSPESSPHFDASTFQSSAHEGLAALNAAFAHDGLDLDVPAEVSLSQPVQVLIAGQSRTDGEMGHLRHRIRLGRHARATVLLQDLALDTHARWLTQVLEVDLAQGAELTLIRVQDEGAATRSWFQGTARLARDAHLALNQIDFGGGTVRNDWRVHLNEPGAGVDLRGLFAACGRSHIDNHTDIHHQASHCNSREFFHGLASDRAQAVFNGRIVVHPQAQKTDSEQRIANLILDQGAQINAKPELEIHADDVRCAHGSTFGQLDADALFYLRSRGVADADARSLLTYGFANEILQTIAWPALRERLARRFLQHMSSGTAPGQRAIAEVLLS